MNAFLPADRPLRLIVNAYVIEMNGRTTAIDAGAPNRSGPTAGRHGQNLAAAGFSPDEIDAVLLTRMHPDHVTGLLTGTAATFPNADISVDGREHAFRTSDLSRAQAPDTAVPWFDAAKALTAAYNDRVVLSSGEEEVLPGLTTVDLHGHTPGHVGIHMHGRGNALLFWAETTDQTALQLNDPERGLIFDIEPDAAVRSRRKAIDVAASELALVAGPHVPFPSFGHTANVGGRYRFQPGEWTYERLSAGSRGCRRLCDREFVGRPTQSPFRPLARMA